MIGRVADEVALSADERSFLEALVRRHKAARSLSDRSRMILLCAEGLQCKEVGARRGVHEHTVGKWRRRFVQDRIEGLTDEYRVTSNSQVRNSTARACWCFDLTETVRIDGLRAASIMTSASFASFFWRLTNGFT